ncbi:MAG: PAS domain S-box protein [Alphaproteobacteria bacterium]
MDRALAHPKEERSPEIAGHWFSVVTGIIDEFTDRYAALRIVIDEGRADEFLSRDLHLQNLAWRASETAGRERALIAGAIAAREPLNPAQIDEVARLRSKLELIWEFIDEIAPRTAPNGRADASDELGPLVAAARSAFSGDLDTARGLIDRSIRAGREVPLSTVHWWTVATTAIDRLLDIAQAVKVHVDQSLATAVGSAKGSLFVASLQLILVLAIGVVSLVFVNRRINRPLQQLSLTMERYVQGDRSAAAPRFERNDEFGTLGKTFEAMMEAQRHWHEGLERLVEERTEEIRARKRALRESETQLRLVTDNLPGLVSYVDRERRYRFVNKVYETWYGIPRAQIVGARVADLAGEANYRAVRPEIDRAFSGQTVRHAVHFQFKDGREHDLDVTYVPHFGDDGEVRGIFGLVTDITEYKRTEEALRASESRLAGILEIAQDAIISVDEHARITLFNYGAEKIFGYEAKEVLGKPLDTLIPSRIHERHRRHFKSFAETETVTKSMGERASIFGRRKDGSEFPAEASISKLDLPGGTVFTVMLHDITKRVQADMETQARARQQEVVAALGQRALAGNDFSTLLDHATRKVAATLDAEFCKVLELLPGGETLLLRAGVGWRDGLVGKATVSAGTDSQAGFTLLAAAPVIVGDLRTETRFTGPPLLHEHGVVSGMNVVVQGDDRPFGVLGVHTAKPRRFTETDIHFLQAVANLLSVAHTRAEAEKVQETLTEQFHQAQKMEAVGTLAGGLAHDFNNILGIIIGYVDLAKMDLGKDHPTHAVLAETLDASLRAKDLVKRLLTFSRQNKKTLGPVRIDHIVEETLEMLRATLPPMIDLRQTLRSGHPLVLGDASHIQQVLVNLCINAGHAIGNEPGVLEVTVEDVEIDGGYAADLASSTHQRSEKAFRIVPSDDERRWRLWAGLLERGPHVKLTVSDTGCGMDGATLNRIFEPFFTTRGVGEGTGLGMATVHGTVIGHGGAFVIDTALGEGAVFQVFFPHADAPCKPSMLSEGLTLRNLQ